MSCRNLDEKLYELRRCGCRRCEEEYHYLRYGYGSSYRTLAGEYIPRLAASFMPLPTILVKTPKEPKMEEPKNIAIKILVDKLKSEQTCLASSETSLKSYEESAKRYREAKSKNQRAIKELAAALKKLGHKDT